MYKMARMTSKMISDANRMNRAAQNMGLGTRVDALEFGGVATPAAGTVSSLSAVKYVTTPVVGDNVRTLAATLLIQTVTKTVTTGIVNPDFPRNLVVKGNDANVTGNVVINGTDALDAVLTETIALSGASAVVGTKAFKTVTSIVLPPYAVAGTETVSVGVGVKIGFPVRLYNINQKLYTNFDSAIDAGTVTVGAGVAFSLYAVAGTMNGTKVLEMAFTV
jgi:hypothetical protein